MDMLLSTGERVSCALCAMAINDLGHRAISLTGSQAGHRHRHLAHEGADPRRARRPDLRGARRGQRRARRRLPGRLDRQGRHDARARRLGHHRGRARRGGRRRGLRDLHRRPGRVRADPRIVPDARKLDVVSFEEMLEMAASGAGVLQLRSVEYARNHGVRIHCRSSFDDSARYRCRLGAGDHGTPPHHRRHPFDRRGPRHADGRAGHARRRRAASRRRSPRRT